MNAIPLRKPTTSRPVSARLDLLITLAAGIRAIAAEAGQPPLNQGEALLRAYDMLDQYDEERGL
jgi:hypothetical protein